MLVEIRWREICGDRDPAWRLTRVLYAYLVPRGDEILYVGKADGTTVRQRWIRSCKEGFWNDLEEERGLDRHIVLVGEPYLAPGDRLTRELLADIESLLIKRIQPWGNIQSKRSRIARPGMRVVCTGGWSGWRSEYRDV